jgi:hypothetical protein
MTEGRSSSVIVLSHLEVAQFSIELAAAHSVLIDLSTSQFCHCACTPLKLSFCFLLLISFWKVSVQNAPLSA